MSDRVFQDVTQKGSIPLKDQNNHLLPKLELNEFSARKIQGIPAVDENPNTAILMLTYAKLLESCGWKVTHLTDCPLSTERFTGNMVSRMH